MLTPSVSRAIGVDDITYTVDETVGSGSVTGSITTDGMIGILNTSSIVSWNLVVSDGTDPSFNLIPTDSTEVVVGPDLTATATQLLFNFNDPTEAYFLIESPVVGGDGPFDCYISTHSCGGFDPGNNVAVDALSPISNGQYRSLTGDDVIASTGSTAVTTTPEPGALPLLGVGLLGLVMVMRKRAAQQGPAEGELI